MSGFFCVCKLTSSFSHAAHRCFLPICMCVCVLPVSLCMCVVTCVRAYVARWSECVPGDPGVIGLVTTRTMWHLQVSAVPLPAELAWSQLDLCHLDWPQLKWPVWDWSRVRGSTGHNKNISLNANLLSVSWIDATIKDRERDYMTSIWDGN